MAGWQSDETLTRRPAVIGDETRAGGGLADSPVTCSQNLYGRGDPQWVCATCVPNRCATAKATF